MTVLEIIELVVVGLLVVLHVVSNFVSAKCSCKLCTALRMLFPKADEQKNKELFDSFVEWLNSNKEN